MITSTSSNSLRSLIDCAILLLFILPFIASYPSDYPKLDQHSYAVEKNNTLFVHIKSIGEPTPFKSCKAHSTPLTIHSFAISSFPIKRGKPTVFTFDARFASSPYVPALTSPAFIRVSIRKIDYTLSTQSLELCDLLPESEVQCPIKESAEIKGQLVIPPLPPNMPVLDYSFVVEAFSSTGDLWACYSANLEVD